MSTEYRIVKANGPHYLQSEVNDLIARGWQPVGGVAVAMHGAYLEIFQAMTKTQELPPDLGNPRYDP